MSTNLGEAATIANYALDNTDSDASKYNAQQLRECIRYVLSVFIERSKCTRGYVEMSVADDSREFTMPTPEASLFVPSRLITVMSTPTDGDDPHEVEHKDWSYVKGLALDSSSTAGRLEYLAFRLTQPRYTVSTDADGWVHPLSNGGDALAMEFYELLAPLTSDSSAINIPDDYIRMALFRGLPPVIRMGVTEGLVHLPDWLAFEQWASGIHLPHTDIEFEKDTTVLPV